MSESNYFRMVSENVPDTVKGPMVDVVVLSRYGLQGGYSDPCRLFRLTRDYLRMLETGEYTVGLLVGRVLESFYRVRPPKKHDINTERFTDSSRFCTSIWYLTLRMNTDSPEYRKEPRGDSE